MNTHSFLTVQTFSTMNILVVGGGIAACHVLHSLLKHTDSITFVSDYNLKKNSSSMAGASIVPYKLHNNATKIFSEEIIQKIIGKYLQLEITLKTKFLYPLPLKVYEQDEMKNFSFHQFTSYTGTYFLHVRKLLQISFEYFKKNIEVIEETLRHEELIIEAESVFYQSKKYDSVIFCEGVHVTSNPFFNTLKMNENWGQILLLEIENLDRNFMYHFHHRLIPIEKNQWWYGANHHWKFPSDELQQKWIQEELAILKNTLPSEIKLLKAFIHPRPTSPGQFPYIGRHPKFKKLYIMNGLGSRGMMHSARYSDDFAHMILADEDVICDYDSNRFFSFFK